jgi:hypothetical protein
MHGRVSSRLSSYVARYVTRITKRNNKLVWRHGSATDDDQLVCHGLGQVGWVSVIEYCTRSWSVKSRPPN